MRSPLAYATRWNFTAASVRWSASAFDKKAGHRHNTSSFHRTAIERADILRSHFLLGDRVVVDAADATLVIDRVLPQSFTFRNMPGLSAAPPDASDMVSPDLLMAHAASD